MFLDRERTECSPAKDTYETRLEAELMRQNWKGCLVERMGKLKETEEEWWAL